MNISGRKYILKLLIVFIFIGVFGAGYYIGNINVKCRACAPEDINFSLFWESYYELKDKYFDPAKIETQKVIYGAITGMVQSLGDPYTVFLSPEDNKKFLEDVSGTFEGIGAEIGKRKSQIVIIAPLEGTPAQKAGLRAGDQILKINDKYTVDITVDEAVTLIRGPKGTTVTLTVFREEWDSPKEIKINRSVIEVPSLKWELKETPEGSIAYIRINQFSQNASSDFRKAAVEILSSPAKKIILDLRNNPGGYLEVSEDIAGWFLAKDQIVVIEDFGNNKDRKEYKASGNEALKDYPLIILINQGSASASEILAGCLRDDRGIKLVGEKSFGKGSVQELKNLSDGSSLKITVAKWLTPGGKLIADVGLEPDVKVEMTDEDLNQNKDPQLDKAIEILLNL